MCLKLNILAFRRKAKENIPVFKILVRGKDYDDDGNNVFTPFMRTRMALDTEHTSPLRREWFEVNRGIHSYANYHDALAMVDYLKRYRYSSSYYNGYVDFIIAVAYIPKGTHYYFGDHQGQGDSYASSNLKVTNEYVLVH